MNEIFNDPLVLIELHYIDPNLENSCEIADSLRTIAGERENANFDILQNILLSEMRLIELHDDDELSDFVDSSSEDEEFDEDDFLDFFARPVLTYAEISSKEFSKDDIVIPDSQKVEEVIEEIESEESSEDEAAEENIVDDEFINDNLEALNAAEENDKNLEALPLNAPNEWSGYFGIGRDLDPTKIPLNLSETREKIKEYEKHIKITDSGVFWKGENIKVGTKIGYLEGFFKKEKTDLNYIKDYDIFVFADPEKWTSRMKYDNSRYNLVLMSNGSFLTVTEIKPESELIYSSLPMSRT